MKIQSHNILQKFIKKIPYLGLKITNTLQQQEIKSGGVEEACFWMLKQHKHVNSEKTQIEAVEVVEISRPT